jgi:hypothetical protein
MRAIIYVLVFFSATLYAQQTSPYAEFYSLSADSARIVDKLRLTGAGMKVKIFASTGKELNARIVQAEVSLVHNTTVVKTMNINDTNKIYFGEILPYTRPGNRILIRIKKVDNMDRKTSVYLSKTDFSFTLE